MKISIITVFPEIYESFLSTSLIGRAIEKKLVEFNIVRMSDMCEVKERIDEPTCGPGVGMIVKPEVIEKAIESCEDKWGKAYKIFFSPQGKKLDQNFLKSLADQVFLKCVSLGTGMSALDEMGLGRESVRPERAFLEASRMGTNDTELNHLILVCPRYEGMDERVQNYYASEVISIGDYVLMGGDLPAQVFLEGVLRYLPGVVGKAESVEKESFSSSFFDYPEYGLPVEWKGKKIPEVVLSGNHAEIEKWRAESAAKKTVENRFDWFVQSNPLPKDIELAKKFIPNHYVALMHTGVLIQGGQRGNTSITSLDIHDVARSGATYGIKNYFIVSELEDQQKILKQFLDFWRSGEGKEYNLSRFVAVKKVVPALNLDDVVTKIKEIEGVEPLIISTSAKETDVEVEKLIDYYSQGLVFKQHRPILFVFGTGQGLCQDIVNRSDYLLLPVKGMTDYNHLSVRSAVAIILDRWLGLNVKT
jgi:tRNA (guanine37-N1)-methyltransferase